MFTHSFEIQACSESEMQRSEADFSQDRPLSNAKVNSTLMKESANWGLDLGKEGAKNLFLCRVFGC